MLFVCHPKILHNHCLQFLLGVKIAPRETENNTYAECWGDKQRALWYVMVFSGVVNYSSNLKSVLDADDLLEVCVCVFDRKACEGSVDEGDDRNTRITQASVVQKYCY